MSVESRTAPARNVPPFVVRPMAPADVPAADAVYRRAFGTAFRLPDPSRFRGDAAVLASRRITWPGSAFVAEREGAVVGSIIGMDWGSVVALGPLTVHPDHWGGGVAQALLGAFMALDRVAHARLTGLFTFPDSPKHLALYERRGFAPWFLTAVMSKTPEARPHARYTRFGALDEAERLAALDACRKLADANMQGLDLSLELEAVRTQGLGETLLVVDRGGRIAGFAICHAGAGTEGGSGIVFVKFAAVAPGDGPGFEHLLDACEAYAAALDAGSVRAGVNTARRTAWGQMKSRGFRTDLTGISMHCPDQEGYARADRFVIDDWR